MKELRENIISNIEKELKRTDEIEKKLDLIILKCKVQNEDFRV